MSAQPSEDFGQNELIHLGGETAVVVPVDEYRKLKALEQRASPQDLDEAEADAVMQSYRAWVAAGRPGARSHDDVMAELLGGAW